MARASSREPASREDESGLSSPMSAASPLTPAESPAPSPEPSTTSTDVKEPESGPQRTKGSRSNSESKEKKKRSRVTPEQLVHLERYFAIDRSPTAARRKEISETLGMQERQTQIWFQNRRAKAKLQDGKNKGRGPADLAPDSPPEISVSFDATIHNLIHEDEPVSIIPCTDLSIGTWKRIATTVSRHDLVAYVCDTKRCLTWFIQSAGFGFKMEIPFDTIVETKFTNAAPGTGLATFILDRPPLFYLETIGPAAPSGLPIRGWKRCSDWTEGMQATKVLRHDLLGSAVQLAHLLRNLTSSTSGSEIALHPPSYNASPSPGMSSQVVGYVQPAVDAVEGEYWQRRASAPVIHRMSHSPQIVDSPYSSYSHPTPEGYYSDYDAKQPRYRPPELELHPSGYPMPMSRSIPRRVSYGDDSSTLPSSASATHSSYNTPSPPLLTTPFNPPGYWNNSSGMSSMRVDVSHQYPPRYDQTLGQPPDLP
ncbi:homeobox-domain-containing protein [Panus rudis PR-1116 ss-1]|nr:homeobox-domain-containing protein [Panus rudis PR-1116 ss-1]